MNNSARNSISLLPAYDVIPYSPHARDSLVHPGPQRQQPSSAKVRRSTDPPTYNTLSRRNTRLPPSSPFSSVSLESAEATDYLDTKLFGPQPGGLAPAWMVPTEDFEELGKAYSWFGVAPNSRFVGLKRSHGEDFSTLPWFIGNGHSSQNWDALLMTMRAARMGRGTDAFVDQPAPRRVLDCGGGTVPHWSIMMLSEPGWEDTRFVSLDASPSLLPPTILPYQASSRLSIVQHNFLASGLPFEDDRFDFVRISCVALGVPEHKWEDLIEEVIRVLVPGGKLEILESDFQFVVPSDHSSEASSLVLMADALNEVFSKRWINLSPLSLIPPSLAINCKSSTNERVDIVFPSGPPDPLETDDETAARVLLHAWALRLDGASHVLAEDLVTARIREGTVQPTSYIPPTIPEEVIPPEGMRGSQSQPYFDSEGPRLDLKTARKLEREVRDAVGDWAEDLVSRAGLARLVEQKFGWFCGMDSTVETILQDALPHVRERLRLYEQEEADLLFSPVSPTRRFRDDPTSPRTPSTPESDSGFVMRQLALVRSEAESELRAVKTRLGRNQQRGTWNLGALRLETWLGTAP